MEAERAERWETYMVQERVVSGLMTLAARVKKTHLESVVITAGAATTAAIMRTFRYHARITLAQVCLFTGLPLHAECIFSYEMFYIITPSLLDKVTLDRYN